MGIIQENRLNAPKPEEKTTSYGAKYVKVAEEKTVEPVAEQPEPEQEPEPDALAEKKRGRQKKGKR